MKTWAKVALIIAVPSVLVGGYFATKFLITQYKAMQAKKNGTQDQVPDKDKPLKEVPNPMTKAGSGKENGEIKHTSAPLGKDSTKAGGGKG